VIRDQGEVLVALLPADLVHTNVDQAVETLGVEFVGGDSFADTPDGVPVNAQEPYDRGRVGLGGQERGDVFEVAGEPRPVTGERHRLNDDPMRRASQPA
jgi:hypothetical protein